MLRSTTEEINNHYAQTDLSKKILDALEKAGKDINALTREDIAPFDEFHIRGRAATLEICKLANLKAGSKVLDLGCGLGGAARTMHTEFNCQVEGIDLLDEYIRTARMLTERIGMGGKINFKQGDALELPYDQKSFDVVFSEHVTMNIEDKNRLFQEVARVLRPGGKYVLYEICAGPVSGLHYPLHWASNDSINFLVKPSVLMRNLEDSGFKITAWKDVTATSLAWNQDLVKNLNNRPSDGQPAVGLNLLTGETSGLKEKNTTKNMQEDRAKIIMGVCVLKEKNG